MKKQIKKIEILIENPYTGEIDIINAGSRKNAETISTHLAEHKLRITTKDGYEMTFSGINQWADLSSVVSGTAAEDAATFARTHN